MLPLNLSNISAKKLKIIGIVVVIIVLCISIVAIFRGVDIARELRGNSKTMIEMKKHIARLDNTVEILNNTVEKLEKHIRAKGKHQKLETLPNNFVETQLRFNDIARGNEQELVTKTTTKMKKQPCDVMKSNVHMTNRDCYFRNIPLLEDKEECKQYLRTYFNFLRNDNNCSK